ncbi:putative deoxyribonuclease TATDN1 [Syncephalis plumigaleata]|nr:putative deoxyribonuclease TATDN1 [Syncephalis plumigaleata]
MTFKLFDIAVNLVDPMFRGIYRGKHVHLDDLKQVIKRAKDIGVHHMMITGGSLTESKEALVMAREEDGLYATVGCHPTRSHEFVDYPQGDDAYLADLLQLAQQGQLEGKILAIGECGLDYDRLHFSSKEHQLKYFEWQFDLAEKTQLPMFLHMRAAATDFIELIKRHRHRFTEGVVHSFTGTIEEMQACIEQRLYIGLNGCSLKTEDNLKVVAAIPEDRIMLETDAPWCDIRSTHAGHHYLTGLEWPEAKKKERFEMGALVKSRNEPMAMRYTSITYCSWCT